VSRFVVCQAADLPAGERRVVQLDRRSICVVNSNGQYFAVRDTCPHQGSSLSGGTISGTMLPSDPQCLVYGLEGQVIRCPWHAWEFDLATGRSLFDPEGTKIKTYPVAVEDGMVVLEV
jgi:nitrite reductase (NADH) small subunit